MELSNIVAAWCALMTTFQGVGAIYGLVDRRQMKKLGAGSGISLEAGGAPILARFNPLTVSVLLLIGTAATIAFGTWMLVAKPLRPRTQTVEKTVYVEKSIPCPPSRTGNATSRGAESPANSGSNNPTSYQGSPAPPEKSKPQ
jgi:hypothetical protein